MKNIILTGFMGSGKTTVGQLLATKLGLSFVDTDALIEAQDGRPISDIFAQSGAATFRQMETAVALELAGRTNLVISSGGRLMLDTVNAAALTENGRVFCLTAAPEEILRRVEETSKRPLLNVPDPAARIQTLLAKREAAYGRFTQIQTDGKTAVQVAEEIILWVSTM